MEFEESDFFVLVSSSYNNSVFDTAAFDINRTALVIQGSASDFSSGGSLTVENVEIPLIEDGFFGKQILSSPGTFLGNSLSFDLDSQNFPAFNLDKCSPLPTKLSFDGLVDYAAHLGSGFEVSWTPEPVCEEELISYVVLYGEDNASTVHFESFPVSDAAGSLTIDVQDLTGFSGLETLTVVYLKGHHTTDIQSGKSISIRFALLSSATMMISE
jgi:hypothetical protein